MLVLKILREVKVDVFVFLMVSELGAAARAGVKSLFLEEFGRAKELLRCFVRGARS